MAITNLGIFIFLIFRCEMKIDCRYTTTLILPLPILLNRKRLRAGGGHGCLVFTIFTAEKMPLRFDLLPMKILVLMKPDVYQFLVLYLVYLRILNFKTMSYLYNNPHMLFLSLMTLIILSSCEDVVDVDLDSGQSTIVIDAEILWQRGTDGSQQTILISKMTDYYNQQIPKVTGAEVFVENQNGDRFEFQDMGDGVYQCSNFNPELNM